MQKSAQTLGEADRENARGAMKDFDDAPEALRNALAAAMYEHSLISLSVYRGMSADLAALEASARALEGALTALGDWALSANALAN